MSRRRPMMMGPNGCAAEGAANFFNFGVTTQ
jgi:hypothetical protein